MPLDTACPPKLHLPQVALVMAKMKAPSVGACTSVLWATGLSLTTGPHPAPVLLSLSLQLLLLPNAQRDPPVPFCCPVPALRPAASDPAARGKRTPQGQCRRAERRGETRGPQNGPGEERRQLAAAPQTSDPSLARGRSSGARSVPWAGGGQGRHPAPGRPRTAQMDGTRATLPLSSP